MNLSMKGYILSQKKGKDVKLRDKQGNKVAKKAEN